jgi:hypothetical protein
MGKEKFEPICHDHVAFEAESAVEQLFYGWDKPVRIYVSDGRNCSGVWFSIEDAERAVEQLSATIKSAKKSLKKIKKEEK